MRNVLLFIPCACAVCDATTARLACCLFIRCESGQEAILACCDPVQLVGGIKHSHSGDPDVMRQLRRVELALKHNGWRGQVESLVTREMRGEPVDEEHLQRASFQKKQR